MKRGKIIKKKKPVFTKPIDFVKTGINIIDPVKY